jgi:hypothetical protein
MGPRYYFGKLKDPLEGLVPCSTWAPPFGVEPLAGAEPLASVEPFASAGPFAWAGPFAGAPV